MKSRFAGPSCKSILYCNPEQPPPTTATRSTPFGRPCLASSEPTFFAAVGVTRISRSSPWRKVGDGLFEPVVGAIMLGQTYLLRVKPSTEPNHTRILLERFTGD